MLKKYSARPYIVWSAIFIVIPLLLIVYFSLTVKDSISGRTVFTFENYIRFLDPLFLNVLFRSFLLAFISTLICLVLGYPLALILTKLRPKTERFLMVLIILPMWMNFLLRTYAWLSILGKNGIINKLLGFVGLGPVQLLYNDQAILLGMIYNFLPFMILPIYTVLKKIDKRLIEASEDLGANRFQTFIKIIFPLSIPGVLSGVTMSFMPAVSSFVIPSLLGGNKYMLIGNVVEKQFLQVGNWNFGSAISVILMVVILILMGLMNKYDSSDEEVSLW